MTDPIADLLTRIRNALQSRHETVAIPASKVKESILKILKQKNLIDNYVVEEKKPQSSLKVFLKYDQNRKSIINQLERVSKPGRRIYSGYKEVKPYLRGMGFFILSTPAGVITDKEARDRKIGGEILCRVW